MRPIPSTPVEWQHSGDAAMAPVWTLAVLPAYTVSMAQSGHYERHNQLLCDFLADMTTNLTQMTDVIEACGGRSCDMVLPCQFRVQNAPKYGRHCVVECY